MADDHDPKDTQVHEGGNTPFDLEGTAEMDRAALLRRLQGDAQSRKEPQAPRDSAEVVSARKTEQNLVVHPGDVKDPTQHYVVPDHLLEQSRVQDHNTMEVTLEPVDDDDDLPTATFSMDALLEFEAVVDSEGRIALPHSATYGRFAAGTRLKVVLSVVDD